MQFNYSATTQAGTVTRGKVEAADLAEAKTILEQKELVPLKVEPIQKGIKIPLARFLPGHVSSLDVVLFTKNLAVMLKSGLTVNESLEIAESQATGKFRAMLHAIQRDVDSGTSFGDVLAKYPKQFNSLYVDIVRTGELGGILEENLAYLATELEKDHSLKQKIRAALVYPAFVLSATFVMGLAMAIFVLPRLNKLFSSLDIQLPLSTRVLIWIAGFFEKYGIVFGVLVIAAIIGLRLLIRVPVIRGIWHWTVLHLPIVGPMVCKYNLVRFCRTLGALLKAGLPLLEALDAVKLSLQNRAFRRGVTQASENAATGQSLSKLLERDPFLFPPLVTRMVFVGEKSGRMEELLLYLADFFEGEIDNATKNLTTTLEPILLVIIGIAVGLLAIAIITPIYQITASIAQ